MNDRKEMLVKTYYWLGALMLVFGAVEFAISISSSWFLIADGVRNAFAGYGLLLTAWAFNIKDGRRDLSKEDERGKKKEELRGGCFESITHVINVAVIFIVAVLACMYCGQAYNDLDEIISEQYTLAPSLSRPGLMVWVASANIIVNILYLSIIGTSDKTAWSTKSILEYIGIPIGGLLSVFLVQLMHVSLLNYIMGAVISVVVAIEALRLMNDISLDGHNPQGDDSKSYDFTPPKPEEEIEYWSKLIGRERVERAIDPNTGKLDNGKFLTEIMGEDVVRKMREEQGDSRRRKREK